MTAARSRLKRIARAVARKARQLWDGCPGPWPVKVVLVALALIEPGPFGEIALVSLSAANAARKAKTSARKAER